MSCSFLHLLPFYNHLNNLITANIIYAHDSRNNASELLFLFFPHTSKICHDFTIFQYVVRSFFTYTYFSMRRNPNTRCYRTIWRDFGFLLLIRYIFFMNYNLFKNKMYWKTFYVIRYKSHFIKGMITWMS